jgi:outer membrane protein OmpA-like peptidoglycan-associated protein
MKLKYRRSPALAAGALLLSLAPSVFAQGEQTASRRLPAKAGDFSLKLESAFAIPLTEPQSDRFNLGGSQTVKGLWALNENWGIGPSATFLGLPTDATTGDAGTAWTFGGSVRLQRSHSAPDNGKYFVLSPWIDADALYVRTGDLNRPGFAAAVGLAMPLDRARTFWLGPFVRYLHILQGERVGFDDHDAKILNIGLSFEVGPRGRHEPVYDGFPAREVAVAPVSEEVLPPPDRDGDGVPDAIDRCPDVAGPADNGGCPVYEKVLVKPDKLELKEKLHFAWNEAVLEPESLPVLDEVVRALKDNKSFRVQVEGHSSSEGADDHNQTLSEARAQAVLDYLEAHGIERERLSSKGFSSSVPLSTNETAAGRENNRRVEFVVHFIIVNPGTK